MLFISIQYFSLVQTEVLKDSKAMILVSTILYNEMLKYGK